MIKQEEILTALKELTNAISLKGLKIKRDFNLLNAHAYATKILHLAKEEGILQ